MGDRISISFKNGEEKSVVLFSHWSGAGLLDDVLVYYHYLQKDLKTMTEAGNVNTPLFRKEPKTVMVDFIRFFTKKKNRIENDFYLGKDAEDGDNSDNGHCTFDLNTGQFDRIPEYNEDDEAEYDEDGNRIFE